jgi:TetR/AcrR family fatty acid metabolism transcriptional regulator
MLRVRVQPAAVRGRPPIPGGRAAILRAAEEAFAHRDYHEVPIADVARAAGVGKGTVYRYFRSKRALHRAVVLDGIERLGRDLADAAAAVPSVRALEQMIHRTLAFVARRRRIFLAVHREAPRGAGSGRRRARLVGLVQQVVEQAIAAGHVRRVDARLAAEMLLGMIRAVAFYGGGDERLEARAAAVVDLFLRGAGTAAGKSALLARRPAGRRAS